MKVAESLARSLAVIDIGQLVTLAGPARPRVGGELRELGIVEQAALLIQDGRIAAVGAYAELRSRIPPDAEVIDAEGRCVTPGFVDAHTHLVFAGNRAAEFEQRIGGATYQQIAAAGGGILSTVKATRAAKRRGVARCGAATSRLDASLRHDDHRSQIGLWTGARNGVADAARAGAAQCRGSGAHRFYASGCAHGSPGVRGPPRRICPMDCGGVDPGGQRRKSWRPICDAFCDDHAFTVDEARSVLTAARRHSLRLRVHAEQFRPGTGAALAAELGAATADHLEAVTVETLDLLRKAGVQPVLLPGSVFALGREQYPPARKMIELGLGIVVATDFNPGSSPVASMPFIFSLACLEMHMSPAEALTAATVNAAHSLGVGDRVGSLEPGKDADFLIHEFEDYRELAYFIAAPFRPRVFAVRDSNHLAIN